MQSRRCVFAMAVLALAPAAPAQKAALTAEQIIEKNIAAMGGREEMAKHQSTCIRGDLDITAMGIKAPMEIYAKAPDKRLIVVRVEGYGEVRNGFDGQTAWVDDPGQGLRTVEGEGLDRVRRDAAYQPALRWRDVYKQVELLPNAKVGYRDAYVLRFSPKWGQPIVTYYDAENFLALRQDADGDDGAVVQSYFSSYQDLGGLKFPSAIRQVTPGGEILAKVAEVKCAAPLDDAQFARPAKQ